MTVDEQATAICAALIGRRVQPKSEVRELFRDERVRVLVEQRLAAVGLELATHIYTEHVALKVAKPLEGAVFDDGKDGWQRTNVGLSRGATALLVIIWAKLILPKRQIQIERQHREDQLSLLPGREPIPTGELVRLEEKTLFADFAAKLGGKAWFRRHLVDLDRHGFIQRRDGVITEGPMLDTLIDYAVLAPRILDGCLAAVVEHGSPSAAGQALPTQQSQDSDVPL